MATRAIRSVTVGSTPVLVAASDSTRTSLAIRVDRGTTPYFGSDNAVTILTGFPITSEDDIIDDEGAPDAALWAMCPLGTARIRVWESFG